MDTNPLHPEIIAAFRELEIIVPERRRNWQSGTPADPAMEERHQHEMAAIRAKISAHENQVSPGTSDPPPALMTARGGCVRAAGKFLRRLFRCRHRDWTGLMNYWTATAANGFGTPIEERCDNCGEYRHRVLRADDLPKVAEWEAGRHPQNT
jgi:hypothetical protein